MISVVLAERPTQKIRQINPETLVMETVENISQQQNISRKPEIIGLELALTKVTNEIAKQNIQNNIGRISLTAEKIEIKQEKSRIIVVANTENFFAVGAHVDNMAF